MIVVVVVGVVVPHPSPRASSGFATKLFTGKGRLVRAAASSFSPQAAVVVVAAVVTAAAVAAAAEAGVEAAKIADFKRESEVGDDVNGSETIISIAKERK